MTRSQFTVRVQESREGFFFDNQSDPFDQDALPIDKAIRKAHNLLREDMEKSLAGGIVRHSIATTLAYWPSGKQFWARKAWVAGVENDAPFIQYEQVVGREIADEAG